MDSLPDSVIAENPELQPASIDIWRQKYCLKDKDDTPVDQNIQDTFKRVAKALSDVEKSRKNHWYKQFLWALEQGAIPAGRIISNAGGNQYKPATSTINCTVSGTIKDSMRDILEKNLQAGLTLKAGCGIGYEFSTLRPKGAYVAGAGASTSGPLSFMDIFDRMCFTVSSAGGRRGAQMATFDISHPDVEDFIRAKREDGRLRQFNLSLLISDEFIQSIKENKPWPLVFPLKQTQIEQLQLNLEDEDKIVWKSLADTESYIRNDKGEVACYIYKTVPATRLWDLIMSSTYDYAEPGFILIDQVNQLNNNWFCEQIRATNPCGEQPLPPYGSCLLGSVNLARFVLDPFGDEASFDWVRFNKVVTVFTRMLDNVVEINGLALPEQQQEIASKRRHGMGYLGLGSALTMLKISYGSEESLAFTERVSRELAITGWKAGLSLAQEKGAAPALLSSYEITPELMALRPEMAVDGIAVGDTVEGKVLHAKYSRYMQKIAEVEPELVAQLAEHGCRFTHHSSIAPTGTIALSLGNNVSNGIEPSFAHQYSRNIIQPGKKSKLKVDVYSYEFLAYKQLNPEATTASLPDYFVSSDSITPEQHIDVQSAAQKWVDSSISKTINVPTDIPFDDFKNIYLYAHEKGLKGCTTFRFNPEVFQGVLVRDEDLKATNYQFELDDGSTVTVKGDEEIEYEGEIHTAANLYDALKEGYYGKF